MDDLVQIIALAPAGHRDPSIVLAASRAGFLGVVNGEVGPLPEAALAGLAAHARAPFGLKLAAVDGQALALVEAYAPRGLGWLLVDAAAVLADPELPARLSAIGVRTLVELIEWDERLARLSGHAGLIVKGHEAGGRVGEETSFILLQKALERQAAPVFVRGGLGLHSAAAAMVGGAAGVVLDDQLLLLKESPLTAPARAALAGLAGLETALIGPDEARWRVFEKPGFRHVRQLRKVIGGLDAAAAGTAILGSLGWDDPMGEVMPLGQGVAFAESFARRYATVGRLGHALMAEAAGRGAAAAKARPFGPGAGVAGSHGTDYPIVQGPMTRVSDTAGFAQAVAEGGGLPMLALALMRPEQVDALLAETAERLDGKPWGVGLLGFAPAELIAGQMEVARKYMPRFALIAGGRPDQAQSFEAEGIATYLHVPSPRLLTMFVEQGARRFVFEGRECGGHVGPLSSFVLWDVMVQTLVENVRDAEQAARIHVLFAGGIHDARSAAIVSAIAAPLVELGIKVGVLMGSAYLFTKEIVDSGAVVKGFQEEAITCARTVTLETGPGHASRAAMSPFAEHFVNRRREMELEGRSADDIREELESFTLGRLRVASKGTERTGSEGRIRKVPATRQKAEGMFMIGQVATLRDAVVSVADVHRAVCEDALALLDAMPAAQSVARKAPRPADVAVVGLGGIFPKAANVAEYWENILGKVNAITEIPSHRWDWRIYFDPDRSAPDKIYSRWGGFLDDLLFDPLRYGIPPNSISAIDPLQLMTLEVVRACLGDAGFEHLNASRERCSLILGASGGAGDVGAQYAVRSEMPRFLGGLDEDAAARLPRWTEDSFAGILLNVAAGRSANRFDLGGVNYTVDAACASSLAAIYQGVLELESGRSDVVIAGGVDTVQGPFGYLCFSKTQALSPRGHCSTFDSSADGIVISEGIAMVALKRLADAERDGDTIYAVLKGVGGSSDGHAKSMTAPHPDGQIRAMRRAYEMAGYSPVTVGLFEAHGTGTVAGDAAELETVTRLLGEAGSTPRQSVIGSVKTLIGHTKATAGVAGLIKATLAVHHGVLPPHGHVDRPNRTLSNPDSPLFLIDEPRPWVSGEGVPRRASVSAFGFGGTNFHITLEAYQGPAPGQVRPVAQKRWPHELLVWRGADRAALAKAVRATAGMLAALPALPELRDLAFTLAQAAPGGALGATLVVGRDEPVAERVAAFARHLEGPADPLPPGAAVSEAPLLAEGGQLAFVFPGQGAQYPEMLRQLAVLFPEMRQVMERADALLKPQMDEAGLPGGRLSRAIYPTGAYDEEARAAALATLTRTDVAQPALGAVEGGLIEVLAAFGLAPDMAAGHSYGELVALHAAGVYGLDDMLRISAARGRAMVAQANGGDLGTMIAAMRADRAAVEAAVAGIADLVVANHNAPRQTILSGTRAAVAAAQEKLDAAGISNQPLVVGAAFHSPLVAAAREGMAAFLEGVAFAPAAVPVFANSTAGTYPAEEGAAKAVLADQLVRGVEFVAEVEAMYAAGARVFLTVGPKAVHASMVRQILDGRPGRAIAIDDDAGGLQGFLQALGALMAEGAALDLTRLWAGRDCQRLDPRSLAPAARMPAPQKHMWWLNGSGARRVGAEPAPPLTVEQIAARPKAPAMLIEPPAAPASPPPANPPSSRPAANGFERRPNLGTRTMDTGERRHLQEVEADAEAETYGEFIAGNGVMNEFQATMQRFLSTQESVLLAYLGAGAPAGASRQVVRRPAATLVPARAPAPARPVLRPVPAAPAVAAAPISVAPAPAAAPATAVNGNGHAPVAPAPAPAPVAAAPVAAAPAPAGGPALMDLLLGLVEERTGYPRDMLGLDQKLEADLGIDSIKRVEIVGALVKSLPSGAVTSTDGLGEKLNACRTLQAMADCLEGAVGGAVAGAARPFDHTGSDAVAPATSARPPRFVVKAHLEDLSVAGTLPPGLYLITDDGRGVASALADRITAAGGTAQVLAPDALPDAAPGAEGPLAGLVHLAPLASPVLPPGEALVAWKGQIAVNEALAHRLLSRFGASLSQGGRVILVSGLGGAFGRGATLGGISLQGGGPGLAKSAQEEWPNALVKAVDLDPALPAATLADALLAELASGGRREVGYPGGRRTIFRTEAAAVEALPARAALGAGAVVLATGGARGITAETLRPLAEPGVTLVLCGRSPLPGPEDPAFREAATPAALRAVLIAQARAAGTVPKPAEMERTMQALLREREIRANLAEFEAAGARVVYRIADVSEAVAAAGLVHGIVEEFGRLDGVLHGAGVIEDRLIVDKDPASWARVVETKAQSALALAAAVDPALLRFFVMFGSVAGRYGNSGQSDYAAANELLNRLGSQLRALWPAEVKVAVLNWGPWLGTRHGPGMVSEETRRKFEAKGVGLVPPEAGALACLDEILRGPLEDVEIVIGEGPWERHEAEMGNLPLPAMPAAPVAAPPVAARPAGPILAPAAAEALTFPFLPLVAGAQIGPGARGGRLLARTLSLPHDLYLEQHRIDGVPVLPAAVALEMAAEACAAVWPGWQVCEVTELRLLAGLKFDEDAPRAIEMQVLGSEHGDASGFGASVELRSPGGRAHYRVSLKITDELPRGEPLGWSLAPAPAPFGAREAYRDMLFHGPCFQAATKLVGLDDSGIVADIRPGPVGDFVAGAQPGAAWLFDPALVDVAAQLAWVWSCVQRDAAALPNRFGRVRRFAGAGAPARMLFAVQPGLGEHQVAADVAVLDAAGAPVFVIEELESTANAALNRLRGYVGEIRV
ncbi:SDR family NAD(P)-dependent oxidoreductase [Ancylobacter sp. MQZ15Z-1]|uniref:SDR family NAD(P)-dependent oxidoreductase n=1 Tax=Ancylobacter mangrovi TaxID=2972472 RepID=A0A9X2PGG4_9HYPH|nr:type I polyketide synthase [Ancylobacter mangrovi]MCS0494083.1 SDR family NAD(P)-dependent oxidoreductase [Ancylobacter mangrovi]